MKNRVLQLSVIAGGGTDASPLDLYATGSPVEVIELFAWGPCLGFAVLFASRMFAADGLARWALRLFAVAGIFMIVGGSTAMVASLLGVASVQSLGLLVCLPAWLILLPAAEAVTVCLLRRDEGAAESAQTRFADIYERAEIVEVLERR